MNSTALLTDLYQLTMANGYFKLGMHNKQACFYQFFRRNPFGSGYTIAAGLENVLEYLETFHFSSSDLHYLSGLRTQVGTKLFDDDFVEYLGQLKLNCEVEAVAEGTVVFPKEPLLRVRGPMLQCQILETALLNTINFQTLIATKASRVVVAAKGREVMDFGLRRAQGPNGALFASRAAFIGGCSSTSNVFAGKLFGIPVKGTQAHSWIMAFDNEKIAFQSFAEAMPDNIVLLVDTYQTLGGIKNAIELGVRLKSKGQSLAGIRLDSGNLEELSKMARSMLDAAGLYETKIVASGDLDEYKITELLEAKSPIDSFGVGTRMITGYDEPALSGVYKLAAIETGESWKLCSKISDDAQKSTLAGFIQTRRFFRDDKIVGDLIFDDVKTDNPNFQSSEVERTNTEDLLVKVFSKGVRVQKPQSLQSIRDRTQKNLNALDATLLDQKNPSIFKVWMDASVEATC